MIAAQPLQRAGFVFTGIAAALPAGLMADVGLVSVVKTVPLGSRKLKTVELKSKPANAPCRKRLFTSCSTSPCENWDGLVPGNMWEGVNVEVIGSLLKYCIITLFKLVSAIAAAKA